MKRLALIPLFLVWVLSAAAQTTPFPGSQPNWGQIGPWGHTNNGTSWDTSPFKPFIYKGIPFRAMEPVNYNAARAEKYPLILFLHGVGEAGSDNNLQLKNSGREQRDGVLSGKFEGFLLYPQSYYGTWGGSLNDYVVEIINIYIRDKNVDPNRIYVHGLSGGGGGTWMMLASYPKVFAAGLPMSNALTTLVPDMPKFKHVPLWYAQGGLDKAPPPSAAEYMVSQFRAVGGNVRYQFFPYIGHGTWTSMYAMPDFFSWMLSKSKLTIRVFGDRTNFCTGQTINVNMGITAGFDGYEWRKNGALMAGANSNEILNNGAGSYQVRFKRGTVWTVWSEPVVLQYGAPSPTPTITASSGTTFPALDGRTSVTLSAPEGKEVYQWSTGATTQTITVSAAGNYTVKATDFNGCESAFSAPAVVTTTNAAGSPVAPTGLVASSASETQIHVSWLYSGTDHKKFEVYRAKGSDAGPYTLLAIPTKDEREYFDDELDPNTAYFYKVRAVNDLGGSAYAGVDAFTFKDVEAPTVPTEFAVTSTSESSVTLKWKSSVDNIDGLGSLTYDLKVNGQSMTMNSANTIFFPNNVAQGKTGNQSSSEATNRLATAALDGNLNSYWSSALGTLEAQDWMYVDLGEAYNVTSVNLRWASDYAVGYKVQTSNDAAAWVDLQTVSGNTTVVNNFVGLTGTGRYVRVLVTQRRGNNNRVRLAELNVYGNKVAGGDQAYIGAVLKNLNPLSVYTFSLAARDASGNASTYTSQLSASTANTGLAYDYYETSVTTLSALANVSPVKSGVVPNFSLTPRNANRNSDFAFIYRGYITVPTQGLYTFYTTSVDGSNLYISDFLIVNNDNVHSSQERSGQIVLAPGTYPIRVDYFKRGSGTLQLEVRYAGPGISKVLIPDAAMNSTYTPPAKPASVTGITAVATSHKTVKLDWQYSGATVTGFEIYRSATRNGTYALVGTAVGASTRTFTDANNLTPLTQYFYKIKSIGGSGESELVQINNLGAGLTYKYYNAIPANSTLAEPLFGGVAPTSTGTLPMYALTPRTQTTNYGFAFEGNLNITTAGTYTFYNKSDKASMLYIDGAVVVSDDVTDGTTERSGAIALVPGVYPIRITFRQSTGSSSIDIKYIGPGATSRTALPTAWFVQGTYIVATTQAIPSAPAVPTGLAAVAAGKKINLSWTPAATTEGVKIFRSETSGGTFAQIASVKNVTTYSDTTVASRKTYYYKLSAFNDGGESAITAAVNAATPNTVPTLDAIPDLNMLVLTNLVIEINAHDNDGDELQYAFTNLPSFGTFENFGGGQANLTLAPGENNAGTFNNIILTVTDGFGGIARDTFKIAVNGNHIPAFQNVANQSITAGKTVVLPVTATDGNPADVLTITSQNLPSFVTMTPVSNGKVNLTIAPPLAERGTYNDIQLMVDDGQGGASSLRFNLVVKEAKTGYTVSIDFNDRWDAAPPAPWNGTQRYPNANEVISNLLDHDGANSEISLTLETAWGVNTNGPVTGANTGIYPDAVMKTFYYIWDNRVESIKIGGLNPSLKYAFKMHAGTTNASVGGSTLYTIGTKTALLNPLNNTATVATISDVTPDANGNAWLKIQTGPGAIYSYINAMQIIASFDDGLPPAAPTNAVAAISALQNSVVLNWKDNSPSETGFKVFRSLTTTEADYVEVASLPVNTQTYEDVNIASNTAYYYKVSTSNTYGTSAFSNVATITTPVLAPSLTLSQDSVSMEATQSVVINITSTDAANQAVTISATGLPSFAQFVVTGTGTATLTLLPGVNDLGNYTATITTQNTGGASSSRTVKIAVTPKQVKIIYVNFNSSDPAALPWNNTNLAPLANATFSNLKDAQGAVSGITIKFIESWGGVNNVGAVTGNNSGIYPDVVMKTQYWESTNNVKNVQVSGLDPQKVYDFSFFGSREGTGDRTTVYTIGTKSVSLNASNNTTQTADISGIIAPSGSITFQVQKTTASSFAYLNALVIRSYGQSAVPEAPTNVSAKAKHKTKNQIELKWVDRSYNETGFQIYRATLANPTFALVGNTGADVSTFTDTGLQSNTTYQYKVLAVNGSSTSAYSNVASATTVLYYVYMNCNSGYNVGSPWNNLGFGPPIPGSTKSNLLDDTGTATTVSFKVIEHPSGTTFGGANPFGKMTGNNSGIYPDDVLRTFYFTEATETARVTIGGLSQNYKYNFVFFGSRDGDGNRATNYTIGNTTVTLNAAFNTSSTVQIDAIQPATDGTVTFDMVSAPGSVYGYLNALVLEVYTEVPIVGGSANARTASTEVVTKESVAFSASPNPFQSDLSISINAVGEATSFNVSLINQLGISMHEEVFSLDQLSAGAEDLRLTLSNLDVPAGVYFVNITTNTNVRKVIRVVKQ
jgi:large repetitive protein